MSAERFVSKQDFFKKKLVLPAVPEIILVQQPRPHRPDQLPEPGPVLVCDLGPNSGSRIRDPLSLDNKLMKMGIRPPHHRLQGPVEMLERNITRN